MKNNKLVYIPVFILFIGFSFSSCSTDDDTTPEDPVDGDPIGTVYYENSFDDMIWGGDYVADERGLRPIFKNDPTQNDLRIIDEDSEPEDSSPGTDGSSDFFEYMAPSYFETTGFEGWDGHKVYERPGYIKVGTSSSRDAFVATPVLSEITEDAVNLEVTFKLAKWSGASDEVFIEIVGGGISSAQSVPVTSHTSWEEGSFTISNATSNSRIRFVVDPTMDGRFFLDDLVISKIE